MNDRSLATVAQIIEWLRTWIADLQNRPIAAINPTATFDELGIDSASAIALLIDLEAHLGCSLASQLVIDFPTCTALASEVIASIEKTQVTNTDLVDGSR